MSEPPVTLQAVHVSAGSNLPVIRVVIHATSPPNVPGTLSSAAGKAHSTARYFQDPDSGGSAHYVEDVGGEEHCVAEDTIAWHAPPNPHSIGIEICGLTSYTRDQWLSPYVWPAVERAAIRARDICERHSLPWRHLTVAEVAANQPGACSHADVSAAFKQSDHTDPGPDFPWDRFLAVIPSEPTDPTHPIPWKENPDMVPVIDTKAAATAGLVPNWESNDKGEMFAWNGARGLRNLSDFAPTHPTIVAMAAHPSGDGVILFGDDRREDPPGSGRYVRSTYGITVGM